jgi:hypothetical protein
VTDRSAVARALRGLVREPLLHFLILGAGLFALHAAVTEAPAMPAALPAAPAPARAVTLTPADVERLRDGFTRAWKRPPQPTELAELLANHVAEEILHREAMILRLGDGDLYVRRRLVEKMALLARPADPRPDPTDDELRTWHARRRHRFVRPARVWFEQVFLDPGIHGAAINDAAARALASATRHAPPGDPSPVPAKADGLTTLQLAHLFGEGVIGPLLTAPLDAWTGPVSGRHGVHLVRVTRREPAADPPFAEVEREVRADWLTESVRGVGAAATALAPAYVVTLPDAARREIATAPHLDPLLGSAR